MNNKIFTTETQGRRDFHNNKNFFRRAFILTLCLGVSVFIFSSAIKAQIAVKGETVWTMAGEPITNGVVLINNGKIEAVGAAAQVKIPANYRVIFAKVVTPGLIDAHSVIGLNGYLNQPHDQMALDGSSPIQPELRAIDGYNAEEFLIGWVRSFGVTTIQTGHQPSALVPGRGLIRARSRRSGRGRRSACGCRACPRRCRPSRG